MKKRIISIILVFTMLIGILPGTAFAAIEDFTGKTDAENRAVLDQLSQFTGGSSDEAYALLESLGLLDENGNLNLSQSIMLDGNLMSLDEIMELLENPSTDLSRIADVDGTPVALGDLKTMIQIEKELARIKETYFSGNTFNQEQLDQLDGLMRQIENEGISAMMLGAPQSTNPIITVTPDANFPGSANPQIENASDYKTSGADIERSFNLSMTGEIPSGESISFSWKRIKGLLPDAFFDVTFCLVSSSTSQVKYINEGETVTIGAGGSNTLTIGQASDFTGYVRINFKGALTGLNVNGSLNAFVELYNIEGTTFSDGSTQGDFYTLPITINKPNAFAYGEGSWTTSMSGVSNYDRQMTAYTGYDEHYNPRWDLIDFNDDTMFANYSYLMGTAKEIYGASNPIYKVDASLFLYDTNFSNSGYMKNALPVVYDGSSPSQQLTTRSYFWNGNEVNLQLTPPQTTPDSGSPYIFIGTGTSSISAQTVSILAEATSGAQAPLTLNTVWPGSPIFTTEFSGTNSNMYFSGVGKQRTVSSVISVYDVTAPIINEIVVPAGTYTSGQYVPIHITFSEPVKASEISLNINGSIIPASELKMDTTGSKAVAMYKVKDIDATTINISSVTNLKDLMDNTTPTANNEGIGWSFPDVTLKSTFMKNAVLAISITPEILEPENIASMPVSFSLTLDQDSAYRTKYAAYNQSVGKSPFSIRITNNTTDVSRIVDTALSESEGNISATAIINDFVPAAIDEVYQVEVIAYEDSTDTTGTIIDGISASFTVKAITFVNGVSVTYPADDKTELSLTDTYRPNLGVDFTGNPTFTSGTWTSSNTDIATIDADGQVILTGTAIGTVNFSFTADDGGINDPDGNHTKSCTTKEYTVIAGNSPALVIPGTANRIETKQNHEVEVRWSSNSEFFSANDFSYTVELFEGNFTENQLVGVSPAYTVTAPNYANSIIIPGEKFEILSVNGVPAYTVRISMPHPVIATETLSAVCYITVSPSPAAVHLTRPSTGLYLLDSDEVPFSWTVDNFVEGITQIDLLIQKTSTVAGKDEVSTVSSQSLSEETGNYTLHPDKVSGLKDTYMITLRAKNPDDEGYSGDSFPLYVYNADALKLEVDGQQVTSLTMDNESVVGGSLPTDTSSILALREELALIEYIGINYNDYNWSQLKDGIKWATSDTNAVSINYRQGGLYEDISRFSMSTYLPETKMALSSVTDGSATITATHANTGMTASVTVDVSTLREKFYLFQLTPMQKTELSYTDKKGVKKSVFTNDDGVLALYEPEGIASDVFLKATSGDGSVWLGTIYQISLLSGERDATRLQLYPLNTFKLRQAAKTEIFLKKPDGSPFTGSLTLRGGVYKNGGYCQNAGLLGNIVPSQLKPLKDGKTNQTVTIGAEGRLTVYMDSTQFWSEENGEDNTGGTTLKAKDNLEYIFEITDLSGYYPILIESNGNLTINDIVRSAESVITLETHTGSQRPFISNQTMDYGLSGGRLISVRNSDGHIGPNDTYPETKLHTTVLLWGQDAQKDYNLQLCDEYGYVPVQQSSRMGTYPFSSIPVMRNTLILSHDTITKSGWIADGKDMGLKARLFKEDIMMAELPVSPRVTDLSQVPKLKESDNITGMMLELQGNSGVGASAPMSDGNKVVNGLMQLLGTMNGPVDGTNFKMLITPSEDNAVFKAFIWAGYDSLGLDEVDYDQNGLAFDYKLAEANLSVAPSLNDLTDMAKGSYDPNKTMNEAYEKQEKGEGSGSTDFGGQLEGYFEAQIQYNFEKGKWEIYVLGGGFTAGFGMSYTYNINAQAGPVPLTATFTVGGSLQIDFKAAVRYSEQNGLKWASTVTGNTVNDYLTTLRINAYVSAFGGLGFDYSVVALKVGLFGKITFDNQNKFLSRTYLEDPALRQLSGQALQLSGEVGIKFVAQFLFISVEFILASGSLSYTHKFNQWDAIDNYWKNTGSGIRRSMMSALSSTDSLRPVSVSATLQSREYLDRFARSWGNARRRMSLFSIDTVNALNQLQTNAYPFSLPQVSDDGQHLLYTFDNNSNDVSDTRIFATKLVAGSYPQGIEITAPLSFNGYGDSGLSLAGSDSFATAAWVRQNASLPDKTAGQTITSAEQALLMNGTEIVVAAYNGTDWVANRLTDNSRPDLAPVVAANGDTAIVAWRSVYAADSEDLLNFTQQDHILYSIYSQGVWGPIKQLYNGTSGAVKGIDAAMLPDGTAAVTYTLDTDITDGSSADYEIGYAIVSNTGIHTFSGIITQDEWMDENPQFSAVKFDDGDYRFVLGWHSIRGDVSDIRMAAINKDGALSNSFIESIAQATGDNTVNVGGDFHFAKMSETRNSISNLSVLWPESKTNSAGETDHSVLRAVKFKNEADNISISAALDVAELPPRTLMDHFDSYVSSEDGKTVKAVIQGSEYSEIDLADSNTYTVYIDGEGNDVYVPTEEVKLFTATATYENKVRLDNMVVDYANLNLNTLIPVQFVIFNAGLETIDSVEVNIKGTSTLFENINLNPNESKTLTSWYPVGSTIENLDYSITADFVGETHSINGTVYLDYPDLGISQFKITSEIRGIRSLQLTLYNSSAATLAGDKNRSVKVGFYDDALLENIQTVTTNTPGVTVNGDKTLTISGEDNLRMIDEGALTIEVKFDIGQYMTDSGGQKSEIPDSGVRIYANVWGEETSSLTGDLKTAVLPEYSKSDNTGFVLLESGLLRNGRLVSLTVEQGVTNEDKTTANVLLRNNSLLGRTTGNLVVSLLDRNGDILEQQQTYTGDNGSFITLDGEEAKNRSFTFGESGNRVMAVYGDMVLASNNAKLSYIGFEGLAALLSDFTLDNEGQYAFNAPSTFLTSTMVSFMTEDPGATVTVNGKPANGNERVGLSSGGCDIVLEVTAADGVTKQRYILYVNSIIKPTVSTSPATGISVNGAIINGRVVSDGGSAVTERGFVYGTATNPTISDNVITAGNGSGNFSAVLTGLERNTTYYFRAYATNEVGREYGSELSFTTRSSSSSSGETVTGDVKEITSKIGSIPLTLDRASKNCTATLDTDKAKALFQSETGVTIDIPAIQGINTYTLEIPAGILTEAQGGIPPTFRTPFGSIVIPGNMLSNQTGLDGKKAGISLGCGDKDTLTDEEKAAIGERPLIQLTLTIDGVQTAWNNPNAPATITIPYTPTAEEMKNPDSILIWYLDGSGKLIPVSNGHYDSETGTVTFSTTHFSLYAVGYNQISFKDVAESAWYRKAVTFIAARGITFGTGNGNYSPLAKITRGEFIVLMMRTLDIAPDIKPKDNFVDAGNTYYTGYLAAAKRLGITAGIGNNMYGPNLMISRQEMFTLMYKALKTGGKLPEGKVGKRLKDFSDVSQIDTWAKEAMEYFTKTAIIVGSGGKLYPKENTTRAEIAQVLRNILIQ